MNQKHEKPEISSFGDSIPKFVVLKNSKAVLCLAVFQNHLKK
jgi:hypothetical protein